MGEKAPAGQQREEGGGGAATRAPFLARHSRVSCEGNHMPLRPPRQVRGATDGKICVSKHGAISYELDLTAVAWGASAGYCGRTLPKAVVLDSRELPKAAMDGKEQDNADAKSETSESSVVSRLSFSTVVSVLPLYSKFTRALTFKNLCSGVRGGETRRRRRGRALWTATPAAAAAAARSPWTFLALGQQATISQKSTLVTLYGKYTRALTFEKF